MNFQLLHRSRRLKFQCCQPGNPLSSILLLVLSKKHIASWRFPLYVKVTLISQISKTRFFPHKQKVKLPIFRFLAPSFQQHRANICSEFCSAAAATSSEGPGRHTKIRQELSLGVYDRTTESLILKKAAVWWVVVVVSGSGGEW